MRIQLTEERKKAILLSLNSFYAEIFDEPLSDYQAERLLAFFVKTLGPSVYNQGVQDARTFMLEKMEDLDAEFYEPEEPV